MTTQLRSTTNLVVPKHLQLPKAELKKGFMFVYGGHYVGLAPVFMQRLWLASVFPEIAKDPTFGKDRGNIRKYAQYAEKYQKAGLIRLKKVNDDADPHFVVAVPLAEFERYDVSMYMNRLRLWFTNGKGEAPDDKVAALSEELKNTAQDPNMQQRQIPPEKVIAAGGFDAKTQLELKECLLGLRLQYTGGVAVVFADFKIKKAEAEQLTSTEWLLIRNVDLYPLLLQWQVSLWGFRGTAPVASFPMSKVSKTLPPFHEGQSRVNEFGLSISADGNPMWLPEKLDATTRYEDLYSQIGDKGDDTFGLIDVHAAGAAMASGEELKVHLPKNIPVLIDWVNNRFAFTQGNGVLKILDLTRYKVCNSAHARNLLTNWNVDGDDVEMMVAMGVVAGVADALFFTEEEMKEINSTDAMAAEKLANGNVSFSEYWPVALSYYETHINDKVALKWGSISTEGDMIWRPLARFIDTAQAAVIAHMDAVNQKFTVSGTMHRLGLMTLIAKYGNDLANTEARANTICEAANAAAKAERVGLDPNWKPPSVPMIMNNPDRPFSLLPHQTKVRQLMKDSPDFAIMPIQAGGGKTPLAIVDVLMEIQNNRSAPYLIMCPSPLVAQYVKEVTYFTSGKVNVIPIVSESLAKHGFERITAMIQSAPRNSVVVVNYDVLRQKAYDVCYGTTNVKVYPIIELLRQFNFGYALLDESHFMKNDSQRTRAAMVLIADIPKKRLASGTMAHDSPSDLALQVAMLDPTLFGSKAEFNARFGDVVNGDRVVKWKVGAQSQIMAMIKSRIVVAKAMRKEWAALLPTADEKMYKVDMSDAQRAVYDAILTEELGKLEEDAKKGNNKALKKFFEKKKPLMIESPQPGGDRGLDEEADEEAEDVADESAGSELEGLLGFALARLEQYMTAPGRDELGARVLKGDDLRSPKVNMILHLVDEHIKSGRPGKVLIFTNYIESAEEIFASADPALQKLGILYTAANKVEDGAQFETNDNKKWMVGVENSMNTGLNFQFVSHLIRVENVWNPGTLEQGNSRINRPEMKKADQRPTIYYSWIITNNSIDVTKVSRLISKMIAVAKFENTDNSKYEDVPDVPVIPMSAEAILERNSWEELKEYMGAFQQLNQARADDYQEYREKHGAIVLTPLHEAATPKDAAIMAEVPYVAGLEVFSGADQGLVRVDEYLRLNASDDEPTEEEEQEEGQAKTAEQRRKMELADSLKGQPIHTEFGDGICKTIAFSSKMLTVALASGYQVKIRFASAFVITKKAQKGKTVREQILKAVSNHMPITAPTGIIANRMKVDNQAMRRAEQQKQQQELDVKREQVKRDVEAALNVELQFNISNGFLGIAYYPEEDADASAALQALGFRPVEPYVFAEVRNAVQLVKQFNAWKENGFSYDPKFEKASNASAAVKDLHAVLKNGGLKSGSMNYRYSSRNQLQNFFRMELKPSSNPKQFKVYPMIEDGVAYLVMHTRGQPSAQQAMRVKSPGIRWQHSGPCYVYYGLTTDKISAKMKQVLAAGIQVANLAELQREFKMLKKQKLRNNEDIET